MKLEKTLLHLAYKAAMVKIHVDAIMESPNDASKMPTSVNANATLQKSIADLYILHKDVLISINRVNAEWKEMQKEIVEEKMRRRRLEEVLAYEHSREMAASDRTTDALAVHSVYNRSTMMMWACIASVTVGIVAIL